MPTVSPSLIPCISPGSLFERLTTDDTLNIRWLVADDPVFYETLNRPSVDLAVRQLIIAKTLDAVNLRLGHQALFPFLIPALVASGTSLFNLPSSWIWDMHVSLPKKWENVRLAKIKRVSGDNGSTGPDYTGTLRLVFTAQQVWSSVEVSTFQADYRIDSDLTYQIFQIDIPTSIEETVALNPGESETIAGFVYFRTLDRDDEEVQTFLNAMAPPVAGTDGDSDGEYDIPEVYEIVDTPAGGSGVGDDYSLSATSHGTGLLVASATNPIPALDSDAATWLAAFNYPFGEVATRSSTSPAGITIPAALFKEFNIIAPSSDEPTGDVSGAFNPVWINRIRRDDAGSDTITMFFATFNVSTAPTTVPVEFASLTLERGWETDRIASIDPVANLLGATGTDVDNFLQEFGRGHVVLSNLWDGTTSVVDEFFDSFIGILDEPPDAVFVKEATRLSSYAVSRVPRYTPTAGQAEALLGSRAGTSDPDSSNRYVVEADQGAGDEVDFATSTELAEDKRENPDIERFGCTGALTHRAVKLIIDASGTSHDYDTDILPRLRILLGRDPQFGDFWWDGTRLKFYNGNAWIG